MLEPLAVPATPSVEALIRADAPLRPRAVAVLDGVLAGWAWADDAASPTAVLVVEDADGTVYAGGDVRADAVRVALDGVTTRSGDLIFGFAGEDDPLRRLVPAKPYWRGQAIDFTDRVPPADEEANIARARAALPETVDAVPIDGAVLESTEWYEDSLHAFGSVERWAELGIGWALRGPDGLLAEATAGPLTRGVMEMGVVTREAHRRRGYGTLVSRLTARACESLGASVWWNANAENEPSLALARRLGFRHERPYEVVACRAGFDLERLASDA